VTIGSLLAYVRQGDVVVVHSLRRGAAEALELVAHGDASSSHVVGKKIEDIKLPKGATIGALVRNLPPSDAYRVDLPETEKNNISDQWSQAQVIVAHHDTVIEQNDHVIVFVVNKKMIRQVEKLFQVNVAFL
jgi:trk system potassium uptake protein